MSRIPRRLIAAAVLVVLLIAAGLAFTHDDGGPSRSARVFKTLDVQVGQHAQDVVVDTDNQLEPDEQREASNPHPATEGVDIHEDTRDETPPGVPPAAIARGRAVTDAIAERQLVAPQQPAGAQSYDCRNHFVVNQSALTQRPVGVALHFTVSAPGSLDAIRRLFNTPSFGASSNLGFELFNLRCEWWVPFGRKAWAQLTANSAYVSIELISTDRSRASWLAAPAIRRGVLAALVADLLKRIGAPARLVDPVGCVFPPGVTDHSRLECGNTHWDVGTHFPWDVFMRQVRAHMNAPRCAARCRIKRQHAAVHQRLRAHRCAPASRTRSAGCKALHARNRVLHAAARKRGMKL